jgi:hypothetical protein
VVKVLALLVGRSLPGGVTGFFSDILPSDRTMALGSTQSLVKMSTSNIPEGKDGRCVRLKTSPPSCGHEIWEPAPPGTLWATPGLLRDFFIFITDAKHLHNVLDTLHPVRQCFKLKKHL